MLKKFKVILISTFLVCLLSSSALATIIIKEKEFSDARKECAMCHYYWMDVFLSGEGTDYVPHPKERHATKEKMCFSCHNGSIGDSRSVVWTNKRHPVDFTPKREIPKIFPLYDGRLECGTCHTAHGVKTDYAVERTIFLRFTSNNSELCIGCHKDKLEGPSHGNHPVNVDTLTFSRELLAAGGRPGTKPNMVVCQSCHLVHGSPYDHLLVLPVSEPGSNRAPLCEGCHTDNPSMAGHGPGKDTHPVNVPFRVAVLPKSWSGKRKPVTGGGGEITCRTCHQPHKAPADRLLVENNDQARLCKRCHLDKKSSGVSEENTGTHPVDVGIENITPTKKVFIEKGLVTCNSCHIPHNAVNNSAADGTDGPILRQTNLGGQFCAECHKGKVVSDKAEAEAIGTHPVNLVPQVAEIPQYWLDKGAKLGPKGEIVCVSCHKIHGSVPGTSNLMVYKNDTRLCGSCHQKKSAIVDRKKAFDAKHPVNIVPTKVQVSDSMLALGAQKGPKGELICNSCHHPHKGAPGTPILLKTNKKNSICFECHIDKKSVYLSDHNIKVTAPKEKNSRGETVGEGGICSPCHYAHSWAKPLSGEGDLVSQLCLSCHSGGKIAQNKSVGFYSHPTEKHMPAGDKETTLPLFNEYGLQEINGMVYCTSCHDPHVWDPQTTYTLEGIENIPWSAKTEGTRENSFLRIKDDADSSLCKECHQDKSYIKNTDHDLRTTAPDEKNIRGETTAESGVCGACHIPHNGINRRRWSKEIIGRGEDFSSQLCKTCHFEGNCAQKKQVGDFTHPTNVNIAKVDGKTELPLFDEKGIQSDTGNVVCYTCHDPHRWDPQKKAGGSGKNTEGDGTNSFLRISNEFESNLCIGCHTNQQYIIGTEHDMNVSAPDETNSDGMTVQKGGVCSACHKVHRGNSRRNWAKKIAGTDEDISTQLCKSCHSKDKVAQKKQLGNFTHPTDVRIISATGKYVDVGRDFSLPLFDFKGNQVVAGKVYCYSCHDPHQWDPKKKERGSGKSTEGDSGNSFLRISNSENAQLCLTCHLDKKYIIDTDHDLNVSAPKGKNRFGQNVSQSGVCGMCHAVHQGLNSLLWAQELVEAGDQVSQACLSCHSDDRIAADKQTGESSHPVGINPAWLIGKANLPLATEFVTRADYAERIKPKFQEDCANVCHLMHSDYQNNILTRYNPGMENYTDTTCLKDGCHQQVVDEIGQAKYVHPTDPEKVPREEVYTRQIMVCTTCHDPHRWSPRRREVGPGKKVEGTGNNSFLRMVNDDNSTLCINCHKSNRTVIGTDHDLKITAPDEKNFMGQTVFEGGPCSACHLVHNAVLDAYLWAKDPGDGQEVTMILCTSCHQKGRCGEKKAPEHLIHPLIDNNKLDIVVTDLGRGKKNLKNYFRIFNINGKRSRNGIISCPSCHNAHRWSYKNKNVGIGKNLEGDATTSFLINKNVTSGVCVDCHSIDAVYRYKYYHVPRTREKYNPWQDIQGQY